jgi:aspartyl-tRNA(Asn)/glutamyl-tRNA(Gln) amidotransferase subunit C
MSITSEEVKKLGSLSRIKLSDEETESLRSEMDSILGYVADINKLSLEDVHEEADRRNVFRNDDDANVPGEYTEKLLTLSPDRDGQYVKVKKIL